MFKVELWKQTGFNAVDIPCGPQLLYTNEFRHNKLGVWNDINIVQDMWEANVILDEITPADARQIDYCIITDEDTREKTCYTVKNFQMVAPNTCKLNLLLDPYNTMGGFEEGTNNIVISGSANRITVPLRTVPAIYPKAEDNTFFTLDEPFQPSLKSIMDYNIFVPVTPPGPTPPEPVPGATGSKIVYNSNGGQGVMADDIGEGVKTIQYCTFVPPTGKKFNVWQDSSGTTYIPGGELTLPAGRVLELFAQWVDADVEDFGVALMKAGKGQRFVITAEWIDNKWNYVMNKYSSTEFKIDFHTIPADSTSGQWAKRDNLSLNDTAMQAYIAEIEQYVNSLNTVLNEKQMNGIRGIEQEWTFNMQWCFKFFNDCNTIWPTIYGNDVKTRLYLRCEYSMDANNKYKWLRYATVKNNLHEIKPEIKKTYLPFVKTPVFMESWVRQGLLGQSLQETGVSRIEFYKGADQYAEFAIQQDGYQFPTQGQSQEVAILITDYKFEEEGKTFVKWNTKPDGTGTDYTSNQLWHVTLPGNYLLQLYAIWE